MKIRSYISKEHKLLKSKKMKQVLKFSILLAMIAIAAMSCKKDDEGKLTKEGKLSPPSWIRGSWELSGVTFRFTSDDIFMNEMSLKDLFNIHISGAGSTSIKETKKTDSIYEVTFSATAVGEGTESAYYSFKKGDGTYIEIGSAELNEPISDYIKFYKK